jgi:2-dehydropantoate 2-reductase
MRRMVEGCLHETLAVARARHVPLGETIIADTLAFIDAIAPGATSSLQRDIADGKPSELDTWNGTVVRLGHEVGVATPLHELIYHSLLPLEWRARGRLQFPT